MYLFSYTFASYFKFGISIVEIKIKDCFQITCFKAKKNIVVEKNLSVTINLYKKMHFSLSQQIKNIYQSMLYQQHTHWRKSFSQLLYFQRFLDRVKTEYTSVCMSFLLISKEEKTTINIFYET